MMALGPARRCEERTVGQAVGPSVEAPVVEEIPPEVPHPWDAPTRVSQTWLRRGDHVNLLEEEEEDVGP